MLTPMRSFTLASGFWLSIFATTSATHPSVTLFSRTSGVCPISSVISLAIFISGFLRSKKLRVPLQTIKTGASRLSLPRYYSLPQRRSCRFRSVVSLFGRCSRAGHRLRLSGRVKLDGFSAVGPQTVTLPSVLLAGVPGSEVLRKSVSSGPRRRYIIGPALVCDARLVVAIWSWRYGTFVDLARRRRERLVLLELPMEISRPHAAQRRRGDGRIRPPGRREVSRS